MSDEIEEAVEQGQKIAAAVAAGAHFPTWDEVNRRLGHWAFHESGEWCGIPVPVKGFRLEIEDRNPWAPKMVALQAIIDGHEVAVSEDPSAPVEILPKDGEPTHVCDDDDTNWFPVNAWYSRRLRQTVMIAHNIKTGKYIALKTSAADHAEKTTLLMDTMRVSQIWHMATEIKAIETLRELVKEHIWEAYFMTGAFIETSKRSGICYIFRRLRPTLAVSFHTPSGQGQVIAALCLHPIAYYQRTHAGSMCPTDDVIAHLLMMRGDEHLFWKRANQHSVFAPEAGL